MRGWREKLWIVVGVGIAVGLALMWSMTHPRESRLATGSQAPPAEPTAALIDNYLAQVRAGITAYRSQRFGEATQAFETARTLQPSEPLSYRYLADLHWRAGRQEQAQQTVHSLATVVRDAYALDQVGRTYEEAGLPDLATQVYREAVGLDPHFPGAHYNLGRIYLEAGDLRQGIAEMQATLRLHPDFPEAHQALGMAYSEQGRFDDAIVHLQRVLTLAPNLIVVRNHLGRIYLGQGRLEEAIQTFRTLVNSAPDLVEARHNLAVAYARQGLRQQAIEQFSEVLRLRPDFHAARLDLGALLVEMGRLPDAIDTLKAGLAAAPARTEGGSQPELIETRYRLGLAYRLAGQRQHALQELEAVLQAQPAHPAAHANLSYLYYQMQDFDRAWRHARRAESLGLPVPDLLAALRRVSVEPP
jgi:tetratricopeptide (TPR) repeat protein